jgi:hypothetical protein
MGRIKIFIATFLLVATLRPIPTLAEAAMAVGLPSDVAKGGVAIGRAWNYATKGEAEAEALKRCLAYLDAPASTRALCKVTESFHDQCAAIAIDPKAGTPGIGWAIAADSKTAESQAMTKCLATAGASRRNFCVLLKTSCDGSAN